MIHSSGGDSSQSIATIESSVDLLHKNDQNQNEQKNACSNEAHQQEHSHQNHSEASDHKVQPLHAHNVLSNSNSTSITPALNSRVRFSTIEVRTFPIILGDNPACDQFGPPLSIDWEPETINKVQLDRYEEVRGQYGPKKRMHQLKMGGFFRQRILSRSNACTKQEMYERMEEMNKIRQSRNRAKKRYIWQERLKQYVFPKKIVSKKNNVASSTQSKSTGTI